jgi:hypothetical protein
MIITGKDLSRIQIPHGKAVTFAKTIAEQLMQDGIDKLEILAQLQKITENPQEYLENVLFADLAKLLTPPPKIAETTLLENPKPYAVFGQHLMRTWATDCLSVGFWRLKMP